ncbi:MAG: hypothetical protein HY558_07605, partial [Euryarchaeota archaeon]|nr:hypothetical protein [Euryarchaeota archaeon]
MASRHRFPGLLLLVLLLSLAPLAGAQNATVGAQGVRWDPAEQSVYGQGERIGIEFTLQG